MLRLRLRKCIAAVICAGLLLLVAPSFGQVNDGGVGRPAPSSSGGLGVTLGMAGGHVVVTNAAGQGGLTGIGLRPGDAITAINGRGVFSVADVMSRLTAAASSQAASGRFTHPTLPTSLAVSRGGRQQILNVPPAALNGLLKAEADAGSATAQAIAPPLNAAANVGEAAAVNDRASLNANGGQGGTATAGNLVRESVQQQSAANGMRTQMFMPPSNGFGNGIGAKWYRCKRNTKYAIGCNAGRRERGHKRNNNGRRGRSRTRGRFDGGGAQSAGAAQRIAENQGRTGPPVPGAATTTQSTGITGTTTGIGITGNEVGGGTTAAALNQQALQQRIAENQGRTGPPVPGAATTTQSTGITGTTTGIGTTGSEVGGGSTAAR